MHQDNKDTKDRKPCMNTLDTLSKVRVTNSANMQVFGLGEEDIEHKETICINLAIRFNMGAGYQKKMEVLQIRHLSASLSLKI